MLHIEEMIALKDTKVTVEMEGNAKDTERARALNLDTLLQRYPFIFILWT